MRIFKKKLRLPQHSKREWSRIIHRMLDEDDAQIVEAVRRGEGPPLKDGLLCKAPQWAYLNL